MSGLTFASILLLRKTSDQERILGILEPERRSSVEAELKTLAGLTPEQIQEHLKKAREEQRKAQRRRAVERLDRPLDHVLPRLVAWLERPF